MNTPVTRHIPPRSIPWKTLLLLIIVVGHIGYSIIFIANSSFVIDGERYFMLFDDAMVSMRYARNIAAGYGPVWNPGGARVEGFSNPLWMLYMSSMHLLPVSVSKMSLLIQITGALLLLLNIWIVKHLADLVGHGSSFVTITAVGLTAFYFPMTAWGLLGMEVSILVLLVSLATLTALKSLERGKFSLEVYVLLGICTLVRLDMLLVLIVVSGFLILSDAPHRWQHIGAVVLIVLVFVGGQTLLRLWYYGYVFPNTYYLKMTGFPLILRLSRGFSVSMAFLQGVGWSFIFLTALLLARRFERGVGLLFAILIAQVMYNIYVGGDAWESWQVVNRFLSVVMPLFFVIFAISLSAFWRRAPMITLIAVLLAFNTLNTNHTLTLRNWILVDDIPHMSFNRHLTEIGLLMRETTSPDARVAVVAAGIIPYVAERDMIDLLGKSDPIIAHQTADLLSDLMPLSISFYPGHNKWDYAYSIGELHPDVVAQLWARPEEATPYLEEGYRAVVIDELTFYYLEHSEHVHWNNLDQYIRSGP